MNTYSDYEIKLPNNNNKSVAIPLYNKKRKQDNIFNLQTGNNVFDPNSISSSPPYEFMDNLKKRMESYYIYSQSVE